MTITAVLWDFGGVLTSSPFDAFNRFERDRGIPLDFIRGVNSVNPTTNAWAQFESAKMSLDEFDCAFADETSSVGHQIYGREIVALLSGELRPRMIEVLKRCKQNYKVACITNNVQAGSGVSMSNTAADAAAINEVMGIFECVIESSKVGIRKPDPQIYTMACELLGIDPVEAIYLDDLGINLKPARALGMHTIKVVSEEQAIGDLSQALGIEFL